MALRPLARVATQQRCSGSALGGQRGEAGDGTRRAAASGAAGVLGTRSAWVRARARGKLRDVHAHSQETGEKEGERRKEKKRRKEKEKEEERKKREGRKRKEERGGIRGGRSRVGDRQPSGAGWDGGEEKEEGFGRCFEVG